MPPGYGATDARQAGCDTGTVDVASLLDSPATADAIERCADPGTARDALTRIVETHPDIAERVRDDRGLVEGLVAVACASRALTNAIVGDG
jgi:hypothetical protein